jgi:acyl carrier protein
LNVPAHTISTSDNFFEIGGNSLRAIRLANAIRKRLNIDIGVAALFRFDTLRHLATFIDEASTIASSLKTLQRDVPSGDDELEEITV